jgi:hypothetical protein
VFVDTRADKLAEGVHSGSQYPVDGVSLKITM